MKSKQTYKPQELTELAALLVLLMFSKKHMLLGSSLHAALFQFTPVVTPDSGMDRPQAGPTLTSVPGHHR